VGMFGVGRKRDWWEMVPGGNAPATRPPTPTRGDDNVFSSCPVLTGAGPTRIDCEAAVSETQWYAWRVPVGGEISPKGGDWDVHSPPAADPKRHVAHVGRSVRSAVYGLAARRC
jgi:hypothetical protein